jgi:transketolase
VLEPPFPTVLKPYGRALVELAAARPEILCLSGDLSKQCEVDLFQERFPDRFIHAGMAEANMMSMAGALARQGFLPYVHTFGVFATRRPLDQVVNAIAYPALPVRLIGFMPGVSSPGGPSHQAIEDVALMRALPNMTVIDVGDSEEIAQVVPAIADLPGPVYLRLKRGEIPTVFEPGHRLSLSAVHTVAEGGDVVLVTSGMMLPVTLQAAATLREAGADVGVVHVPVIKPLDRDGVQRAARRAGAVVTVENHSIIGGLGSAVAEVLAEEGVPARLRRVGIADTFAEGAKSGPYLFEKYGLSTQHVVDAAWSLLGRPGRPPRARTQQVALGEYAPV